MALDEIGTILRDLATTVVRLEAKQDALADRFETIAADLHSHDERLRDIETQTAVSVAIDAQHVTRSDVLGVVWRIVVGTLLASAGAVAGYLLRQGGR